MATNRPLTLVLLDYNRAPSPGRDALVATLRREFPTAGIDTFVPASIPGSLRIRVNGPSAAQLAEAARLYLGSLGIRYGIERPADPTPLRSALRAVA